MDLKQKMIDLAREATGDDEIGVAGEFRPKGMLWKQAAGAAAGSLAGGAATGGNEWGQTAGAIGGAAAGTLASTGKGVPLEVVIAASPTKVYLLSTKHDGPVWMSRSLDLVHVIDREQMSVTIKKRMMTRTIVIEDEATGAKYEMEGLKIGFHHTSAILDLIEMDQHHIEAMQAGETGAVSEPA
jgi:hypothetical protein